MISRLVVEAEHLSSNTANILWCLCTPGAILSHRHPQRRGETGWDKNGQEVEVKYVDPQVQISSHVARTNSSEVTAYVHIYA